MDCVGGNIPHNAVQGGNDPSGETYYIGRAIHNGTVTVGKVHKSHETCYVAYGKLSLAIQITLHCSTQEIQ